MPFYVFLIFLFLISCQQKETRNPSSVNNIQGVEEKDEILLDLDEPLVRANAVISTTDSTTVGEVAQSEKMAPPPINIHPRSTSALKARITDSGEDGQCGDYKTMLVHNGLKKISDTEFDKLNRDQILKSAYYQGRIVIHHSAGSKNETAASVINYHIRDISQGGRGWTDAGYHFMIDYAGEVHEGRPLDKVGAHVHNVDDKKALACNKGSAFPVNLDKDYQAIGISLLGNFDLYPPSSKQMDSLKKLVGYLKEQYQITEIQPHRHYKNKSCPGKNVDKLLASFYQKKDPKEKSGSNVKNPYSGDNLKCKFCDKYKGKSFKADL